MENYLIFLLRVIDFCPKALLLRMIGGDGSLEYKLIDEMVDRSEGFFAYGKIGRQLLAVFYKILSEFNYNAE